LVILIKRKGHPHGNPKKIDGEKSIDTCLELQPEIKYQWKNCREKVTAYYRSAILEYTALSMIGSRFISKKNNINIYWNNNVF